MARYDYVIAGAGSAGCVLAARLSEDPDNRVLLVEAGGRNRSPIISMPSAFAQAMNSRRYNWGFRSEPEPGLDGRRLDCPRGLGLGGSSSINGMVYVRGHPEDFSAWEAMGATGWSYRHCLPYFREMEAWEGGRDCYRGVGGPLSAGSGNRGRLNPLYAAFIEAGREAGYGVTEDYNGFRQEGFGFMQMTVVNGMRCSAARAYLGPACSRPNLRIVTGGLVDAVTFDGVAARGLQFWLGSQRIEVMAEREVILCAGAIGSPAILQRSGVGPPEVLRGAGVRLRHPLSGVGENLQDHLEICLQYRCTQPITLNGRLTWRGKAAIALQWLLSRSGLGATNHFESCGFIRSARGVAWPDIQYHFLPAAVRYDGRGAFSGHGFQLHVGPNRPASRGHVRIRATQPDVPPAIRFNYLLDARDRADWRTCIGLSREIVAQPALDPFRGAEIQPGATIRTDAELDAWVRSHVESAYHPCGTCRMGADDDPLAVLDARCRVRGLDGLRIVDASAFPRITNGNINAPTLMLAERAADMILGRTPLPPVAAPVWIDPRWQDRQRERPASRPRATGPC